MRHDLLKQLGKQLLVVLGLTGVILSLTPGLNIAAGGILLASVLGGLTLDIHELLTPSSDSVSEDHLDIELRSFASGSGLAAC